MRRSEIGLHPPKSERTRAATASAQIGAIIGNGTSEQIENLGQYAKTLGVLMTIR